MDAENRYCLGCKRTLNEIACWGEMTDEERAEVMLALPLRSPLSLPPKEAASS